MTDMERLRVECVGCRKCAIGGSMVEGKFLSNVFSNMNCTAKYMVVGQNPGRDEVEQGFPFVGLSGQFFDRALENVGLSRRDFYVCNTVCCYTPDNRKPTTEEMENCRMFLDREVKILKPRIIVALGSAAFKQLTGLSGIMKHHGTRIFSPRYRVIVIPLLHPSPLNLNYPDRRVEFEKDMVALKSAVDDIACMADMIC